jgi:hypothetical protein
MKNNNEVSDMLLQILLLLLMISIGCLNYYLSKSYWCHEGIWGERVDEQ